LPPFLLPAQETTRNPGSSKRFPAIAIPEVGVKISLSTTMNLHIERRKRFRKKPPRLVYVEMGNGNGGMMRDLSEDGFALRAMMPLATGEKMHFCLSLEDSTRIEGESQVIWTGEGGRAAGLKFVEITAEARTQVRDWLAALDGVSKEESREETKEDSKESRPVPSASELVERLRREARSVPPRPVSIKQESSVSVASPDSEQQEQPPPRRPPERPLERVSIASQMLPSAAAIPPTTAVSELPATPASVAHSPVAPSHYSPPVHAPVWQKQPPVLVPLPSLEDETEGGELAAARRVRRSLFSRTFGFILLLALAAGTWFYHEEVGYGLIWLGQQLAGIEQDGAQQNKADATSPAAVPSQATTEPALATAKSKPPARTPNEAQVRKPDPSAASTEPPAKDTSASTTKEEADPATQPAASANDSAPTEAAPDAGQAEYSEAMRILGGDDVRTRLPEAVRLLWVSVEKGNSNAEVTLADLYREGRGVKKNCEQTRVLLSAAARKGNALAQTSLKQFIRDGCE
jgi:hypothetical protein